jgi:hypothetical protein
MRLLTGAGTDNQAQAGPLFAGTGAGGSPGCGLMAEGSFS